MPPQTRSSTRTVGVKTRASLARAKSSQKAEAPKVATPSQKRKAIPKSKPKRKPKKVAESESESDQESKPARKRVRRLNTKQKQPLNEELERQALMNMPVEVLIEIARYVHPLDLIMLSRVNKFFRELFMDKRSAMIWRSAQENLPGLPPCPDGVCEPQYAAMIFTKRCSVCGGFAPREMDPALLARLCVNCRNRELVDTNRVTDPSLLMVSRGVVPGNTNRWTTWCLYDEARAVKIKLNEFNEAGDQEALQKWKEERRTIITERKKMAELLGQWLKDRERKREQYLDNLKTARQEEIQSRLIKLGWDKDDFVCRERWRYKQWQSMVFSVKPLTEKIWENILPSLLGHLELNHSQRLERERSQRRGNRSYVLYSWVNSFRSRLPPYARAIPIGGNQPEASTSDANYMGLRQACPSEYKMREWEEYKALLDNDVPHEQFLLDFEETKPLIQQSIAPWQSELEKQLIKVLPDDTRVPDFALSTFNMVVGTGESAQPISTLPEDIQKLMRADTIFSISSSSDDWTSYFYPETFNHFGTAIDLIYFHAKAHEVAKALLTVLGSPDASYLSLSALGKAFRCGRCSPAIAIEYTWKELVEHYLSSILLWKGVVKRRQVQSDKEFVYVCTHDINSEISGRPLVQTGDAPHINLTWNYSRCIPCQSHGLGSSIRSQEIMDHLRDVHLIEVPEVGVHYRN